MKPRIFLFVSAIVLFLNVNGSLAAGEDIVGSLEIFAEDIHVFGNYAFLASGLGGFYVIDVSRPEKPVQVASVEISGYTYDFDVSGSCAYLAAGFGGLVIIDISEPLDPKTIGNLTP